MKLLTFDNQAITNKNLSLQAPLEFQNSVTGLFVLAGGFDNHGDDQVRQSLILRHKFILTAPQFSFIDDNIDTLRAKANKGKRWLVAEMRDAATRGTWAKMKSFAEKRVAGNSHHIECEMIFEATWPWWENENDIWYLDTGEILDDSLTLDRNFTQQVGAGTFTINNTGGDTIRRGAIVVKGSSTNPVITNSITNESITYTGTVASGSNLVFDLGKGAAQLDGANAWANTALGANQNDMMTLVTGDNPIIFAGGGTLNFHWARVN